MADDRSDDLFDRYEPSLMQILVWVAIGLLLNFAAEPLLVPYLGASMAIVSTYLFVRNGYPVARTLAWTLPTAALFVVSVIAEGWTWALFTYVAVLFHGAFYVVAWLRSAWYGSPA